MSGAILHAAGGRFSASLFDRSDGIDLGPTPASPEDIATRWSEILGAANLSREGRGKAPPAQTA
jgi:hypothetical protein